MAIISGFLGHTGVKDCWKFCNMPAQWMADRTTYYLVLKKPDKYDIKNCNLLDIWLLDWDSKFSQAHYDHNLWEVLDTGQWLTIRQNDVILVSQSRVSLVISLQLLVYLACFPLIPCTSWLWIFLRPWLALGGEQSFYKITSSISRFASQYSIWYIKWLFTITFW